MTKRMQPRKKTPEAFRLIGNRIYTRNTNPLLRVASQALTDMRWRSVRIDAERTAQWRQAII
jgi:hypothetical protein